LLTGKSRRVETVIGQLPGRYHLKRVWARGGWDLWPRWQRKLPSHTLAVYLCQQYGLARCGSPTSSPAETRIPG
jgi:hypothetical protein